MLYHVISLGCPKNRVDSERFAWVMHLAGWKRSDDMGLARLVILNTCAFIAPATEESLEYLSGLIQWKAEKPDRKIVLAGCLPGRYRDDGSGGLEDIDLIIGPGDWRKLSAWLHVEPGEPVQALGSGVNRYLKIANGCSNGCAYCTIPSIRGPFVPEKESTIFSQADFLVKQGAREIGIVAQDTGNWHCGETGLLSLTETLASRYPSVWWRLYYLHPLHIPRNLPELFSKYSNIMPYVDMPVQHASNAVLARMGRGYDLRLIETIMDELESSGTDIAVRYTVITGYPGETKSDFDFLRDFLGRYRSGRHIAAFSWYPEEGTLEYARTIKRGDAVDDSVASTRLAALSAIADSLYAEWDEKLTGRLVRVLADEELSGHTVWDAPEVDAVVTFTKSVEPGTIVSARIIESSGAVLLAEPEVQRL